jgi:hypothetical protein
MKKELILEIIQERWSPYSFSSSPVEEFNMKAMFEAVGYPGDGTSLSPELLKRDEKSRSRKSVKEFVFRNSL